jgi:hypothetical protein
MTKNHVNCTISWDEKYPVTYKFTPSPVFEKWRKQQDTALPTQKMQQGTAGASERVSNP